MTISTALCTSFKAEVMRGLHDFTSGTGNTFKIALYSDAATLDESTTVYSSANEISASGYVAGGATLTSVTPTTSGTTGFTDFDNVTWASTTITASGALIYNSTNGNRAVCVLSFGSPQTSTPLGFTVIFPAADAANAIVRIA